MSSYEDLLSTPPEAIERPRPLPVGHYTCSIKEFKQTKNQRTGNDGLEFIYHGLEPDEDVDEDELAEFGPDKLAKATLRDTFWITADALFRLKNFLFDVLHVEQVPGQTLGQYLTPDLHGLSVKVSVVQRPSQKDPNQLYANIAEYLPVE